MTTSSGAAKPKKPKGRMPTLRVSLTTRVAPDVMEKLKWIMDNTEGRLTFQTLVEDGLRSYADSVIRKRQRGGAVETSDAGTQTEEGDGPFAEGIGSSSSSSAD